jgi:patatin-like phospholipase/acyl hydrolase
MQGDEPNPLDEQGLCLLSLGQFLLWDSDKPDFAILTQETDGGGVRGLSTLYILRTLMTKLNHKRQADGLDPVKPCDVFDLIGGTSTGGYVELELSKLH